jgi:predicted permease
MPGRVRTRIPPSTRAFRALLSLYPSEFRDEYGREVVMVFEDRHRDASGIGQRALVWIEAIAGVLTEAPKEHARMVLQDLRFAARLARRSPAFTLTAILTLALGIGANGAIFQLIDAVGLQALPVRAPRELAEVRIAGGNKGFGINPGTYGGLTRPVWQEIEAHQEAFSSVAAWALSDVRVGERSSLQRQRAIVVSGEFFNTLGVRPHRGRLLDAADSVSVPCPGSKAVVSHGYWQRALGGREIGKGDALLKVDGAPFEIVGVTPPGFFGLAVGETFDIALPFCVPKVLRRDLFSVGVFGRLRPGWTIDRATAHLDALSTGIFEAAAPTDYSPDAIKRFKEFRLEAASFARGASWLRSEYTTSLRLLLAIAGLVLLIAAANLANLLLARASAREREVAIRLAIGASRGKLIRQFLAESVLLAALGAVFSILLARILSRALVWALTTEGSAPTLTLATNWRVLLFTAAVACATCIVFGVAPALRATGIRPAEAMKSGGRGATESRGHLATQRVMVVTQVAVSLVLLVAALLFVRSFRNLMTFDPGIRLDGISIAFFGYPETKLPPERLADFQRQLVDEIRRLPGIVNAATTTNIPLLGASWEHGLQIGAVENSAKFTWVGPEYFNTMGVPILEGRRFSVRDTRESPRVAVVNQTFVRNFGGGARVIGQTLRTSPEPGFPSTVYEIVGVIPDTRYSDIRNPTPPMVFAPDAQYPGLGPWAVVMIQSRIDPAAAVAAIAQHMSKAHPEIVAESTLFQARVRDRMVRDRLLATLAGFFGILAAVLAMVGLYGMISFAVAQRRQEIGIRVALGANRRTVVTMLLRDAARLVAIGVTIGMVLSLAAGRAAPALLFGLEPHDPLTLGLAAIVLTVVAGAASYLPARGASRLDPLAALRHD